MTDDDAAPDEKTVELVYDLFRGILDRQMEAVDALDTKAVQTIAAATVAAGVSAIGGRNDLCPEIMAVALVLYVATVTASVCALWPRRWARLHGASSIWNTVWSYTPAEYQHAMIARISEDAEFNQSRIATKAMALRVALVLAALQVAAVVIAVVEATLR